MKQEEIEQLSLAALLHDIGKFSQRADVYIDKESYDFNMYCPFIKDKGYFTHQHAAYSAEFLKEFVNHQGENSRFIKATIGDESFENISAKHHKPETPKEWLVAIADRVASGFERDEFEKYNNSDDRGEKLKYYEVPLDGIFNDKESFRLEEFNQNSIFTYEYEKLSKEKYLKLYEKFKRDLEVLKKRPKTNFNSGLEYLLKKYTSFIPSSTFGTKANIPLYDHLKTTATFASAISKYHENDLDVENIKDYEKKKFLLIAGDFFGIQEFIFSDIPTKKASKILRGKSAFIQIFIKVVALDICKKLGLSNLSIISTSAGKFEILAANTSQTKEKLEKIKEELNEWFIKNTFGESGIGLSYLETSCSDFTSKRFANLRENLSKKVENEKYKKFDLLNQEPILEDDISTIKDNQHLCKTCNKRFKDTSDDDKSCDYCNIFIRLGQQLVNSDYINIVTTKTDLPIFENYYIKFNSNIDNNSEIVYDISNSEEFRGYEKWALKSYVKYSEYEKRVEEFEELSQESCDGSKEGVKALMALKGDVDNMGVFLRDKKPDSFAKFNFISRLIDYFFSVKVSQMMEDKNLYTVFAGGDDLFLLGAWNEVIDISKDIREEFMRFCSGSNLSISMGMVMFKPSKPINYIANISEEALEKAKEVDNKNALTLFRETVKWDEYLDENNGRYLDEELVRVDSEVFSLNTAFTYRLIELIEMSKRVKNQTADFDMKDTMWKSKLAYSFSRNVLEKIPKQDEEKIKDLQGFLSLLNDIIEDRPEVSKMIMSEFIYKRRD